MPVILQDEVAGEMSMLVDGVPYLNYNTVKDSNNPSFAMIPRISFIYTADGCNQDPGRRTGIYGFRRGESPQSIIQDWRMHLTSRQIS